MLRMHQLGCVFCALWVSVSAYAAAAPAVHANKKTPAPLSAPVLQPKQTIDFGWQQGKHFFADLGVENVHSNANFLSTPEVQKVHNGSPMINQNFGWNPKFNVDLGFHFENHGLLSGLMGEENSISAGLSYMSAARSAGVSFSSEIGVTNGQVWNIQTGAAVNPDNSRVLSTSANANFYMRETNLSWRGQHDYFNGRLTVVPSLALVYNWQNLSQTSNSFYWLMNWDPTSLSSNGLNTQQEFRYYGLSFGEGVSFALNKRLALSGNINIQALNGWAHFRAEQIDGNLWSAMVSQTIHENLTDRETMSLGLRFNFLERANTPYFVINGGVEHWGWVPVFAKMQEGVPLHYTETSVWNPYYGISIVIPFVS